VQNAVDMPLCLDSPIPKPLSSALKEVRKTLMINSISGESMRLINVLPFAAEHGCPVIALSLDNSGIPKGIEDQCPIHIVFHWRRECLLSITLVRSKINGLAVTQNSQLRRDP
jgi:cobalamin-dependent methionine synthase I